MCDEKILLCWVEQYQAEIRKEVEMVRRARLVKARQSGQLEPRVSFLGQLWRACGFGGNTLEKPVASRATV
jgi:hypothetical protein